MLDCLTKKSHPKTLLEVTSLQFTHALLIEVLWTCGFDMFDDLICIFKIFDEP